MPNKCFGSDLGKESFQFNAMNYEIWKQRRTYVYLRQIQIRFQILHMRRTHLLSLRINRWQ